MHDLGLVTLRADKDLQAPGTGAPHANDRTAAVGFRGCVSTKEVEHSWVCPLCQGLCLRKVGSGHVSVPQPES